MASAGRKIGIGIMGAGVVLAGAGMLAGGASAETGGTEPCSSALTVTWGLDTDPNYVNVDPLVAGGSIVISDGTLNVTLSSAAPIPGQTLSDLTIGSLDFATNKPVDSVELRLWQAPGDYDFDTVEFAPAVNAGVLASEPGSHPTLGQAPIKGLELCYEVGVAPTSTIAPTSTAAPTSSIAPSSTVANSVAPQEVTAAPVAVEVLPQVETAPQTQAQIAFTGSDSGPLIAVGAAFVVAGLALVGVDRAGIVRKGRHSR